MQFQERKKNPSAFLRNIFQILNNPDHFQIIHWVPQGNGFVIKDLPSFEANILPLFFKHKKYSSFVRQLNMYGFHKQRNSSFQNRFLHENFKRGHELPTDIKRKPQKKKKMTEQTHTTQVRNQNWLSFSHQLRRHLPHIANNILLPSDSTQNNNNLLNSKLKSEQSNFQQSKMIQQPQDQGSEQYISKISLRGFIEDIGENSQNLSKEQSEVNNQNDSAQQNKNSLHQGMNQLSEKESQSKVDEFSERRCFSFLKFNDDGKMLQSRRLSQEFGENDQNLQKFNHLSTVSFSFLDNNLDTLEGCCDVLIKQNQILQKTHSTIRNVVLKSRQNKISYLNHQVTSLENTEENQNNSKENKDNLITKVLDDEKQKLCGLAIILQHQIRGLTEFMLSEQDLPISTTSIKCRLQRLGSNNV